VNLPALRAPNQEGSFFMNPTSIVVIVVALGAFVFFQFRSSRKRAKETAARQESIVPGVDVMTNYGLHGKLISVDNENNFAMLEISPGTVVKIHKSTILKVADDLVSAETADEAASEGNEPSETSYELNKDNAIDESEPKFGERVDPPKKPVRKTTKKVED